MRGKRGAAALVVAGRGGRLGLALVGALVAFAALAPAFVGASPDESDFARGISSDGLPVGPCAAHLLGTDSLFRDELARLAHGARLSLTIGVVATLISSSLGAAVGVTSGYLARGRFDWVDVMLMRTVDALLSFPYLLLVMAIGAAVDRPGAGTVLLVLGATSWLGTARVVRAKTLALRELGFVEAAVALGQRPLPLLVKHVLPNLSGVLVVTATATMASMILAESVLSYLQVGVPPPTATWGRMLYEGQASTLSPRLVIAPGVAVVAAVLGFTLLGEALRDALDAPRARR